VTTTCDSISWFFSLVVSKAVLGFILSLVEPILVEVVTWQL